MEDFNKCFCERTIDGICAVIFWPANMDFISEIKEEYILVFLNDTPSGKSKCWFCVRKSAVPEKGRVKLKVPSIMAGKVIGYGGTNIKKIAKVLGGRYVTVQKV